VSVYLVGAGPGRADLLTLRAAGLLARAQAVVVDRLVDDSVLDLVAPGAVIERVGDDLAHQGEVNDRLVELAARFDPVVRLKGGDPYVFGRGGEEAEHLARAGVGVEVVPGVSSAFAAPAAAGIPVTHRGLSRGVAVVSATGAGGRANDLRALGGCGLTVVVLMGVARRAAVAEDLVAGGLDPSTPVAVVQCAQTAREEVVRTTLGALGDAAVRPPAVIVVGAVAALDLARATELARAR
jgi:uroporphyrin-III C-methyltransferase